MSHPTFSRSAACYLAFGFTLLLGVSPAGAQTLYVTNTTNISTAQSYSNGFIGSSNLLTSLTGNLTIDSGAVITVSNTLTLGNGTNTPNNRVTVSGSGTSLELKTITVGSSGSGNSVLVTNGGKLSTDGNTAGGSASSSLGSTVFSSNNSVIIAGSGSSWMQTNTNRSITVGDNGSGNRLVVSNGAFMSTAVAIVVGGATNSSNNSIIVTGAGTVMTNGGFNLQRGANHSLTVSDGAQVVANEASAINGALTLGNNALGGSAGHSALVTGAGTALTLNGAVFIGAGGGAASMVVSGGADVVQTNSSSKFTTVGQNAGGNGSSLQVTGAGTVWSNSAVFTVGAGANTNSAMTVSDGALVAVARGVSVGDSSNTTGALMTVDNATLNIFGSDGPLRAGFNGSLNRVVVTNGGDITVTNAIYVGQGNSDANGSHSNTMLVTGAGSSVVQAALTGLGGNVIGSFGRDNALIVSNGATVLMGGSSAGFAKNELGGFTNSSGNSLVVTDAGSVWGGRGDLEIGVRGSSNFASVLNGGLITNGTVRIGASNSANANYLLVDGVGSVFSNRISVTVGNGTNTGNRVTVTNGGVLHAGNTLDIRSNSTVTAAGSVWVGRDRTSAQAINVLNSGVTSTSTLTVNGTLTAQGNVTIANLGLLTGAGTITASNTTIASGGRLSPGNSPGTITVDGNMTWLGGGNYNWQIHNATGLVGTGWDFLSVTGALDLSALTSGSKFNINLWSLSAVSPDTNGAAINFDNTLDGQSWDILVAAGGITGFDAADFNIRTNSTNGTGGFANSLGGGFFGIEQQGNVISLTYTVPEPSTYALLALAAGAAGYVRWRNRKKVS